MSPNHYLSVAISYLFRNRMQWGESPAVGKTVVSSSMIDRVAKSLNRELAEVPVGFKWFVEGLLNRSYGFGGEESAGASFLQKDGGCGVPTKMGSSSAFLLQRSWRSPAKAPLTIIVIWKSSLAGPFMREWMFRQTGKKRRF